MEASLEKKMMKGRIWHVEKKKKTTTHRNGLHVDLGKEVNSILVNNEEEKDVDGLEEK